jgi:L-fuconolactonase
MIVDAHHHVWDPDAREHAWLASLPSLRRRFSVADYVAASGPHRVTASVLVQVLADSAETEDFLALADAGGPVAGVIGWVDLTSPAAAGEIARLQGRPGGAMLVGVRHLVQGEPDPAWLERPDVLRGLASVGQAGLVYDLLVRPGQLAASIGAATGLPEVRFVLDHGGKPGIAAGHREPWAGLVRELARLPNVSCKLSGLVTEAGPGWTAARIAPFAAHLLDCFGPERLMFGSDWPVCTAVASYGEVLDLARSVLDGLSPAEQEAVLGANAAAVYRLRLPAG